MLPALGRSSMPDLGRPSLSELETSASFDHVPSALWEEKPRRRTSKLVASTKRRSEPAQRVDPKLDAKLVELVEWVRESAADPAEDGLSSERAVQLYTRAMGELQELIEDFVDTIYDSFDLNGSSSLEFEEVHAAVQRKGAAITDVWEIFGRTLVPRGA